MPAPKSNTVRGAFTRIIFEGSAANVIANFVAGSSTNDKFPHLGDLLTGADGPEKEPRNEAEHSSTVSDEKTTSIRQHIAVIQKQLQPWGTVSNLECKPLVVELLTRDIEKTLTDLHSGKIKRNINEFLKQHVDEQPLRLEFLGVESMEEFAATEPEFQELEAIAERYINKLMSDLNKHFVTESPQFRENQRKASDEHKRVSEIYNGLSPLNLPSVIKKPSDLLELYKICLNNGKIEEANQINFTMHYLLKAKRKTTGNELRELAREMWKMRNYEASIPILYAAAHFHKKKRNALRALREMRLCVVKMWKINVKMVENGAILKQAVQLHVIPLMRDVQNAMDSMKTTNVRAKCVEVVWAMHEVALSEDLVGDTEAAIETFQKLLARIEDTFHEHAEEQWIYADLIAELGDLHQQRSQYDKATVCYQQAIDSYSMAKDFDGEEWKDYLISVCEGKLIKARQCGVVELGS